MSQKTNPENVEGQASNVDAESPKSTQASKSSSRSSLPEAASEPKAVEERTFSESWKTHRFWLVRGTYYVFHSIWVAVIAVGAFIAWIIAMLFI